MKSGIKTDRKVFIDHDIVEQMHKLNINFTMKSLFQSLWNEEFNDISVSYHILAREKFNQTIKNFSEKVDLSSQNQHLMIYYSHQFQDIKEENCRVPRILTPIYDGPIVSMIKPHHPKFIEPPLFLNKSNK